MLFSCGTKTLLQMKTKEINFLNNFGPLNLSQNHRITLNYLFTLLFPATRQSGKGWQAIPPGCKGSHHPDYSPTRI